MREKKGVGDDERAPVAVSSTKQHNGDTKTHTGTPGFCFLFGTKLFVFEVKERMEKANKQTNKCSK